MKRYKVVQGYQENIVDEVKYCNEKHFTSFSEAREYYDKIKKNTFMWDNVHCTHTQIRLYYDDEKGGYLENEETIACYEYHY